MLSRRTSEAHLPDGISLSSAIWHISSCHERSAPRAAERREAGRRLLTERRPHLGEALGAALWARFVERGWVLKKPGTREVIVTDDGKANLESALGVRFVET